MYSSSGLQVNVQATVELPETYILARCTASDNQLLYGETRLEDIRTLAKPIVFDADGIQIHDEMRFFTGISFKPT